MRTFAMIGAVAGAGLLAAGTGRLDGRADPPMALADMAFLAGTWTGELGGTPMHETWLAPVEGNMTGCLRWYDEAGGVRMYELFSLTQEEPGAPIRFRLRHFDAEMSAWASERDGPLAGEVAEWEGRRVVVRITTEGAGLERIEYDATGEGSFTATLRFTEGSGREPLTIDFKRG